MEDIESIDLGSGDWPREFEAVTHFTFWLEWYHTHIHILVFSDLMTYPFWAWHDTTPWYRYTTLPFLFAFVYYSTLAYFHHFLDLTRQNPRWLDLRWALDDDIWIMMREWFDYLTMLLSHCTWLQRVRMIRDDVFFFMRRWWVDYDDRVRWLSEDIDDYHRASVGAFTRFWRSWHDFVGRMPVFSIGHVRSWKHDVRGFGQRMGGHHFRSLFTLSPSHIELSIASPLSLARAS